MSLFSFLGGGKPPSPEEVRACEWQAAIRDGGLPTFVTDRLVETSGGKLPWVSTMTAAEMMLCRSHGFRPLAVVIGTCWLRYANSWTLGHEQGWRTALARLKLEAAAVGASAVVDVRMRTSGAPVDCSMDFSLTGTAVSIPGVPPAPDPACCTTPAFECVRLLEAGIVPTGLAVGAYYKWLESPGWPRCVGEVGWMTDLKSEALRTANDRLRADTARQGGSGVLAGIQFGQLRRYERDRQPDIYLVRHIAMGTVVECRPGDGFDAPVTPVIDLAERPVSARTDFGLGVYGPDHNDSEGPI